ncbi:BREX-1 system phosphatase PglZ type B [Pseudonocardia cypriaca]|uniref:PglZ domain-containing protein n=1 Tax=Pseudonocardia cypriaca TaxID=882449 RepID=A0A543GBC2_9PSEU|nr:BREX-1 system phosphatase PglZ type B [Pseudonocardia cypriaca]TQM43378.1 hypothetical protein FB388_0723 [Pseudonocardia cypriaca]
MSDTVLDRLVECLAKASAFDPNVQEAPVALLWPDEEARWQSVIGRIAGRVPLVSLGAFEPAQQRGPAYWVRCVVAGTIDAGLADGRPVIYLPGVPQGAVRAVETCAPELAPIAELQYRSRWFANPKGRDWTVRALLADAEHGLGLMVADNAQTNAALLLALDKLLDVPINRLKNQVLDADYCNQLVNPDPPSLLLGWLDDPAGYRSRLPRAQWVAFVQQCKADYGFDPELDGEIAAARRLAARDGNWDLVWKRFAEMPQGYRGVPEQLRKARPLEFHVDNPPAWPQDNENDEDHLRSRLADCAILNPEGARKEIARLNDEHARRRTTVWAGLGQAPLAFALEQLVALAELTAQPLAANDLISLASDYTDRGWRVDDTFLRALGAAPARADRAAVAAAGTVLYRAWADSAARAMQTIIGPMANAYNYEATGPASTAPGVVSVFVDGFRLDIAHRVQDRLVTAGLAVECATGLAALPTVTATAKAALAPVGRDALTAGPGLQSRNTATGTAASIAVLRSLMGDNGVQVLGSTEVGDPTGSAWAEAGELDRRGHDVGSRLVDYLDEEVDRIVGRVRELLDAGWLRVDVLTDHGWLLMPGGLEKVELPAATTEVKKGRCARVKDGAVVEVPTVPWFWDRDVRIAVAPGLTCFEAGKEYEHGGVSPQECIVPRLTVTASAAMTATGGPEIRKVTWLGLLCRIELSGAGHGVVADLRGLAADPNTSIAAKAKETSAPGRVSLAVPDEDLEGQRAHLVLVGPDGEILADRDVIVGRNR